MKAISLTLISSIVLSLVCFTFIVIGSPLSIQLLAILWLLLLFASMAVLVFLWNKHILEPLKNISCQLTILNKRDSKGTFLDLKSLKDVENAIHALAHHLEENSHSSLLAEMSHEIRTPLNGIIGFLSNLNDTALNTQQKQFLKIIDSSAHSLLHVINQILDYSKLDAGGLELENIAFDLRELTEDCCTIASQLTKNKNIKTYLVFPFKPDTGEPHVIVRGDPTRLKQVLDNLLSNAVKFTSQGEICLEVNISVNETNTYTASFSVRDTGIGISSAIQQKLFRPFRQADASIARTHGGTGLGLSISASLVKLMGGTLAVHSKQGEGSNFFFTITLEQATAEEQVRQPGPFTVLLPRNELKKHRALLVDDTSTNLFLLETVCQNAGLPYRTAQNGQEALDLCLLNKFDVIFMDIQMPIMDGYTAIREIRKLPNSAMTHIVALTASAYQDDIDRALRAGASEFIPKPFEKNQLLLCIADALAITPEKILQPLEDKQESEEEKNVRLMHEYMREQYQISLGEIKMTLAQTVADWRPLLDNLKAYIKSGNQEQAQTILHRLKGQLASIGLPQYAETAALLNETLNENPVPPSFQNQLDDFIRKLSAIFKTLEQDVTVIN